MHVSQVPLGIPVTAVDSDGEEDGTSIDSHSVQVSQTGHSSNHGSAPATAAAAASRSDRIATQSKGAPPSPAATTAGNLKAAAAAAAAADAAHRGGRLGMATPPLSDEGKVRNDGRKQRDSMDSDDSETMLPWARASSGSLASSAGSPRGAAPSAPLAPPSRLNTGVQLKTSSHLPPSPISSAESPIHTRDQSVSTSEHLRNNSHPIYASRPGHESTASSVDTINTSESDEDPQSRRRDQTFSIYDVYGRDSVAFPNFDFRELNNGKTPGGRILASNLSMESLNSQRSSNLSGHSVSHPNLRVPGATSSPLANGATKLASSTPGRNAGPYPSESGHMQIPAALRTPSGRRPSAAPPPTELGSAASTLRRKLEASSPANSSPPRQAFANDTGHRDSSGSMQSASAGGPGSFDPKRRPSIGNSAPMARPMQQRSNMPPMPAQGPPRPGQSVPPQLLNRIGSPPVGGAPPNHFISGQSISPGSPASLHAHLHHQNSDARSHPASLSTSPAQRSAQSLGSGPMPPEGMARVPSPRSFADQPLPSPSLPFAHSRPGSGSSSPGFAPARSSSDRSGQRERVGSGQLRKNPSNPQPGAHGGMSTVIGLAPVPGGGSGGSGGGASPLSRSPSPFSATSASSTHPSLAGARNSPMMSPTSPGIAHLSLTSPNAIAADDRTPVDALGFFMGSGMPFKAVAEDHDAVEKWQLVLQENDLAGAKKSRKVKKLVHAGIPQSMRKSVWLFLANASTRRRAGLFEQLCKQSQEPKARKAKLTAYETIEKDLDRCFPDHRLFRGEQSSGKADLEAILKAYVHYNPTVGYTQGMGLIVGWLLIQMPAEEAFWLFCAMLRDVHVEGYYGNDLKQLHIDGIVLGQLLQSMDPQLAQRLTELGIEPIHFTPSWFLPLFVRILPWETLLRVWDVFFFEGPQWIQRVGLAIVRIIREPLMDRQRCPGHAEALQMLLHPPQQLMSPDNVLGCAFTVKLKDGDVRKLSRQASKLVRTSMGGRGRPAAGSSDGPTPRSTSAPPAKR